LHVSHPTKLKVRNLSVLSGGRHAMMSAIRQFMSSVGFAPIRVGRIAGMESVILAFET
jgi:hypothetical protein